MSCSFLIQFMSKGGICMARLIERVFDKLFGKKVAEILKEIYSEE